MERRFAGAIIRATAEKGCPAITNRPCAERIRPVQAARSYNNRHSQNFDRFRQRDDVMLQLRYRDVSDASEEPNLMVNEKQSGFVRRQPFLVSFLFHSFAWFVAPFQLERS